MSEQTQPQGTGRFMKDDGPVPFTDPLERIFAAIDERVQAKVQVEVAELWEQSVSPTLTLFATAIAELQAGEGGVAYRAWIVEEAKRLQVRPGEVAKK